MVKPCLAKGVGGCDGLAAGKGHDSHALAGGGGDVQEALEHVDDLFKAVDADGAGLPDEGLPDGVLGGEGGGV